MDVTIAYLEAATVALVGEIGLEAFTAIIERAEMNIIKELDGLK